MLASASVRITDRTSGVNQDERYTYLVPLNRATPLPEFSQARTLPNFDVTSVQYEPGDMPAGNTIYEALPSGINLRWMNKPSDCWLSILIGTV